MATKTSTKRKLQRTQAIIRLLIVAAILICVNMLAARFHWGLDLTKEKRFTLTDPTKQLLRNMDDVAVIDIYLDGKFPAGYQRLKESTIERLKSFRDVAGNKIIYRFNNPLANLTQDEKSEAFQQLVRRGVIPLNIQYNPDEDNGYAEKFVVPYAMVQYHGKEEPVLLLEHSMGLQPLENLEHSESLLEYKFATAISRLSKPQKPEIAYIMGNEETLSLRTLDILSTLPRYYKLDTLELTSSLFIPSYYKAIIINNPKVPFDDKDKFKIDQYVMNGGRVLWAVDQINTPIDSLSKSEQFLAMDMGLNLNDMLFKYGARINYDLIEDLYCVSLPVTMGQGQDGRPQMALRPWIYYPVFGMEADHPITKNMSFVMGRFVSSIDTIKNPEIKKTILLQSSKYSRVAPAPLRVSLSILRYPQKPEMFTKGSQPAAVLLEGKFRSLFRNRLHPDFLAVLKDSLKQEFVPSSDSSGKMILIADGEIMLNDFSNKMGPLELGYWQYTNTRFANKEFVLNCLEYLTNDDGLLVARSKDSKLRQLDPNRIKAEKQTWVITNIGVPLLYVFLFASVYLFFRKRRYERKAK